MISLIITQGPYPGLISAIARFKNVLYTSYYGPYVYGTSGSRNRSNPARKSKWNKERIAVALHTLHSREQTPADQQRTERQKQAHSRAPHSYAIARNPHTQRHATQNSQSFAPDSSHVPHLVFTSRARPAPSAHAWYLSASSSSTVSPSELDQSPAHLSRLRSRAP